MLIPLATATELSKSIYIYIFFREKLLRQWFPDLKPSIPLTFNGTILDYFGDKTLGGHYGIAYY